MTDAWDEMLQRVSSDEDKVLFCEAAKCARSGALRAAYVCVWLSCAESMKRKFREAALYDGAAKKISADCEAEEAKHQAIDSFLLGEAKTYGFIVDTEYAQLEAVYQQRCIYGHPYEKEPLQAQLQAAAATVIEYVLSRSTKLRHGYLDRQVDLLCSNLTFLDDLRPAVEAYAEVVYARADAGVHTWFLRKLWKETLRFASDPSMAMYYRRVSWFSESFLGLLMAGAGPQTLDFVQDLTDFPTIATALSSPIIFPKLTLHAQDIVIGEMLRAARQQSFVLRRVEILLDKNLLNARQNERFVAAIQGLPMEVLAGSGISPVYYIDTVISKLKVYDWYTQNPTMDVVAQMGVLGVGRLPQEKQMLLGNNVLQAAEGGARRAQAFLSEMAQTKIVWPCAFVNGVLSECVVNAEGQFRFKPRCLREALMALKGIPANETKMIIDQICTRLSTARPKTKWISEGERKEIMAVFDAVMNQEPSLAAPAAVLRNTIAKLEVPSNE